MSPEDRSTMQPSADGAAGFWREHLQPFGFGLRAEVLEYPGGMPRDIGFFLTWE
jgi:hypothetical protein